MAHVYEKQTKDTVDFPAYVLCFLGAIMNKLEFYGFIEGKPSKIATAPPNTLVIPIVSRMYSYCFDAVSLIEKTFNRKGFVCKMEKYKVIDIDEKDGSKVKGYSYDYRITKKK